MNIRATCPDCGDVVLPREDMRVRICAEDRAGSYTFRCPSCRMAVAKPAEDRIVQLLVAGGVKLDIWHIPAELFEAVSGPPITYDDILDFHIELQSEDWMQRILA
jgi:rRNA maturation protein Nop10